MASGESIAIVGGGLAGLAAAHALQSFGLHAAVYEAAPELGEIVLSAADFTCPAKFPTLNSWR